MRPQPRVPLRVRPRDVGQGQLLESRRDPLRRRLLRRLWRPLLRAPRRGRPSLPEHPSLRPSRPLVRLPPLHPHRQHALQVMSVPPALRPSVRRLRRLRRRDRCALPLRPLKRPSLPPARTLPLQSLRRPLRQAPCCLAFSRNPRRRPLAWLLRGQFPLPRPRSPLRARRHSQPLWLARKPARPPLREWSLEPPAPRPSKPGHCLLSPRPRKTAPSRIAPRRTTLPETAPSGTTPAGGVAPAEAIIPAGAITLAEAPVPAGAAPTARLTGKRSRPFRPRFASNQTLIPRPPSAVAWRSHSLRHSPGRTISWSPASWKNGATWGFTTACAGRKDGLHEPGRLIRGREVVGLSSQLAR